MWKLNMFLNNKQVKKDITRQLRKYLDTTKNENTAYQNLWDVGKAVLRGKFIAVRPYT